MARAEGGPFWWEDPPAFERVFRVTATGERGIPADLDGRRGRLGLWRAGVGVEATVPLNRCWTLGWTLHLEESSYRFSDADAVVAGPGRLMEEGIFARFTPTLEYRWPSGWGVRAGPIVQSAGATGARFEDTLTWGGQASVRIPLGERTALVLGASAQTTLEGALSFGPLLDFESSPPSTGRLHLEFLRSGISGTGIRVGYDVTPRLSVGFLARYDRRDFRLADDDRVPGGVFRNARLAPGLDLRWLARPCVQLSAAAWLNVSDSFRFDDRNGDFVTDFGAAPSPMIGLTLSVRF